MSDLFIRSLADWTVESSAHKGGVFALLTGKLMLVNFLNPNATKPLHVGHLRNLSVGEAWSGALELAGAEVIRQCYICDFGRNVCEALAGYLESFCEESPDTLGLSTDQFVGNCYARYCQSVEQGATQANSPIGGELCLLGDAADGLVSKWLAGDPEIRAHWQRIRTWALDGQERTLKRVGTRMERRYFESESLEEVARYVAKGISQGLFVREESGAVVYPTGRSEYPVLELVRSDGLPTEHARVIALFLGEQQFSVEVDGWSVVCGDEWDAAGGFAMEVARKVDPCPLAAKSTILTHGMVTLKGAKMKSRDGQALLIDDFLDQLESMQPLIELHEEFPMGPSLQNLSLVLAKGFFLSRRIAKTVEFSWDAILDPKSNPAWSVARAWAQSQKRVTESRGTTSSNDGSGKDLHAPSTTERIAAMQALQLRQILSNSAGAYTGTELMKFAVSLSNWYLEQETTARLDAISHALLRMCLRGLGLFQADSLAH